MLAAVFLHSLEKDFDQLLANPCRYRFGIKPGLTEAVTNVFSSDCSGFTRYLLHRASSGQWSIPEGSVAQHEYLKGKLRAVVYSNAALEADPTRLFIGFLPPRDGEAGHVWFLIGGNAERPGTTIECHAGKGADSRPWDTPILKDRVTGCYEIPVL